VGNHRVDEVGGIGAREAPHHHNAVIPGLIDTALTHHEERCAQAIEEAGQTPEGSPADEETARRVLIGKTPAGVPWIEPEDVAQVVTFLASDAAYILSGQPTTLPVAIARTTQGELGRVAYPAVIARATDCG
jgi:NAD(P)-dependent dehydrogenase (short-subunit alcohol dehydrogenase family)